MATGSTEVPARLLAVLDWIAPPRGRPADVWRQRMLALSLARFSLLTSVPYAIGMKMAVTLGQRSVMIVDSAAYLLLLTVVLSRRMPYAWRAGITLALPFLLGTFLLARFGPSTSGFVWLMTAAIMASVFFAFRMSVMILLAQGAVLSGIAAMLAGGTALWPTRVPGDLDGWIATSSSYLAVATLLTVSIAMLFRGLAREAEARRAAEREADRQQQLAALGTVATAIAHDVNNLLQPLLSDLELLRHDALSGAERTVLYDRMMGNIDLARGLIRRAQRFARPNPEARITVDLAHVVPEAIRAIRAMIPPAVQLRLAPVAHMHLLADSAEIQQLLVLMVANASQGLSAGGTIRIAVTSSESGALTFAPPPGARFVSTSPDGMDRFSPGTRVVSMQVHDDGIGIAAAVMNALSAKTRGPDGDVLDGMGLGTVREVAHELGGFLRLCSRTGEGSCVEVVLPQHEGPLSTEQTGEWRQPERSLGATPAAKTAIGRDSLSATPRRRASDRDAERVAAVTIDEEASPIVVVDDETAVLQAARRLLERTGYRTVCVSDPLAVVGTLATLSPPAALVLCDVHMPGLDGWQLAEQLHLAHPDLPVILMSGHVDAFSEQTAQVPGVTALLAKPFTSKELGDTIGRVFREAGRAAAAAG